MRCEENRMKKTSIIFLIILASSILTCLTRPVAAGDPIVSDIVVYEDSGITMLNVTVFHSPQYSIHYLDFIEVDLNGSIITFPVAHRPQNTFTVTCDLGPILGTPTATVRAHCNIDGYSQPYGPIIVPEFTALSLLLVLVLTTLTASILFRKRIRREAL
jgi:hypothetical protein